MQSYPTKLEDLDISIRCLNLLKTRLNVNTVKDLEELSLQQIESCREMSSRTAQEILELKTELVTLKAAISNRQK